MAKTFDVLLKEKDLTTAQVARATEIPYNTLNDWRKGRTKKIGLDYAIKLADYFDMPVSAFYEGKEFNEAYDRMMHELSAGQGRINDGCDTYHEDGELATIVGDSMLPTLHNGDIVRVVETTDVSPSDYAVVRINGDELTIKHIEWVSDGLWVRAENKEVFKDRFYSVKEIATTPVQVVGKAVEVRRKL